MIEVDPHYLLIGVALIVLYAMRIARVATREREARDERELWQSANFTIALIREFNRQTPEEEPDDCVSVMGFQTPTDGDDDEEE